MNGKLKETRGGVLVEAALIFPIIILTLVTMIYILIHMYQQTCTQSIVDITSEREGYYLAGTISTQSLMPENRLYYYLRSNEGILEEVTPYVDKHFKKYVLTNDPKIKINFMRRLMYSQIEIMTYNTYSIPLFRINEKKLRNKTRGIYYVHDEAEYVRNVDLILDEAYSEIDHVFEESVRRLRKMEKE